MYMTCVSGHSNCKWAFILDQQKSGRIKRRKKDEKMGKMPWKEGWMNKMLDSKMEKKKVEDGLPQDRKLF